jgi:hypothetical protein
MGQHTSKFKASKFRPLDQSRSIIYALPVELWLCVADFLPFSSIASLAVTTRYMFYCMQRLRPLQQLRRRGGQNQERVIFLQYLEELYPKHVLCHACISFHRLHTGRFLPRAYHRSWDCHSTLYTVLKCEAWQEQFDENNLFDHCIFNYWAPKFWLVFHLVMRSSRLGLEYGIPLSAIQQLKPAGITRSTTIRRSSWKTDFRAVIVNGSLLIQERIFRVVARRAWIYPRAYSHGEWRLLEMCCHHYNMGSTYRSCFGDVQSTLNSLEQEGTESQILSGQLGRCKWCPTEWQLHLVPKKAYLYHKKAYLYHKNGLVPQTDRLQWIGKEYMVLLVRYCDLGECRSPRDTKWTSLIGRCRQPFLEDTSVKSRLLTALNSQSL